MKFKVVTLGCKVNNYESDALAAALIKKGYFPADTDESTDLAVINTCSVTSTSDKKSRQQIRKIIREFPDAIVVAMGCYVQIAHQELKKIAGIDILVGTSLRSSIPELVEEFQATKTQIDVVERDSRSFTYEELGATSYTHHTRAYLKIQDGCDNFCSFCIIPYARGRNRSRAATEVIKEAIELTNAGYPEIVLTGIHTGGYGRDLPAMDLTTLAKEILKAAPNLQRLRISSIEETEITPELIALVRDEPRMAKHFHIPLQSGSTTVLKRMNRHYDTTSFLAKLAEIRKEIPDVAITTDVIVGFPDESDAEFLETVCLIKEARFSELHVFPYSPRSGTAAARMANQIDGNLKKERVNTLLSLSEQLKSAYAAQFKDQQLEVIFENYDPKDKVYRGHTSNYLLVETQSTEDLTGKTRTITYNI